MVEPWPFVWRGTSSLLHDTFHFLFSCARWGVCWWHLSNYIAQKSPSQAEVWPWKQGRPLRWWSCCSRMRVDNILAMPPEVDGRCCAVAMTSRLNRLSGCPLSNEPAVLWRKKKDVVSLWILGDGVLVHLSPYVTTLWLKDAEKCWGHLEASKEAGPYV